MMLIDKNTVSAQDQMINSTDISFLGNPEAKKRILIAGNSITKHGPKAEIGWHGDWGMAASAAEKDYVHRLYDMLTQNGQDVYIRIRQCAKWERGFLNEHILEEFADDRAFNADLVIFRLGENVAKENRPYFKEGLRRFAEYLCPNGEKVFTTCFWANPIIDTAFSQLAEEFGIACVDCCFSADPANMALGLFEHEGVALHPGDAGMEAIAQALFTHLKTKEGAKTDMKENELWYARQDHIPVLGHRGIKARYPENTLVSFRAAIDLGVDLIEFDVNMTKDHELVVIHDNLIDRTSNGCGLTRDYTLEQLKRFDFGGYFSEEFRGAEIPTLREVLQLAAPYENLLLNVEIKDMADETVDKTIEMIREFGMAERCVIACFDAAVIRYVKRKYPEMRAQGFPGRYMQNFTEDTYDCMFGMGIPIGWGDCTEEQLSADVAFAKSRGILAWLFCADTEADVRKCVAHGCDNITGNDPAVALQVLREMKLHR